MSHIILVSCCSVKLEHAAPAKELYCSQLFNAARRYAEANGDEWYILSAMYGLVAPDEILKPYDLSLRDLSQDQRSQWGWTVYKQAKKGRVFSWYREDRVTVLAGAVYARAVDHQLYVLTGAKPNLPLQGLGIGQQLQWFKQHNAH